MLEKTRAVGAYDRPEHADVVEFLALANEPYDLVFAADVFIYIDELAPLFAHLQRVMARGIFCFSSKRSRAAATCACCRACATGTRRATSSGSRSGTASPSSR